MKQMILQRIVGRFIFGAAISLSATSAFGYSPNDVIATYAGNGTSGYSGDGGPAVSATLNTPSDIAVDSAGNLYISDPGSSTIRKVSTSGIITTIAGTGVAGYNGDGILASTAQLNNARGITFDSADDLYIADTANNRIRKITFSTGLISTVAGTGANGCSDNLAEQAVFSGPVGVALDSTGILYISDTGNHIVRKLSGGMVTSIGGTCSQPQSVYESPQGLVTDSAGNVYVDVTGQYSFVLKYDSSGNGTQFAGNGSNGNTGDGSAANSSGVTIYQPYGIARDTVGNIFIGSGSVVRVVTPDGIIHTSAGNGTNGSSGDGSLATSAELKLAQGLAVNSAGRLFIVDQSAFSVRIVGPVAPVIVNIVGDGIAATDDGVVSADGRINCPGTCGANYVSEMPVVFKANPASPDLIYQWSQASCDGKPLCDVVPVSVSPTALSARFTTRYIKTALGGTVGPTLDGPFALTFDADGNMFFSETGDCVVKKLSVANQLTVLAGNGICGNLGDGMPGVEAELNNPEGVVVDASGNVFIQDTGNGLIRKVTADGILHTYASGLYGGGNSPALFFDANGSLYTLGSATTVVRIVNGAAQPFLTVPSSDETSLDGLAMWNAHDVVIYGVGGGYAAFTYETSQGFIPASESFRFEPEVPADLVIDGAGLQYNEFADCRLFAHDFLSTSSVGITLVGPGCSYTGDNGPANLATLNNAVGLAFDHAGRLTIADFGNNAIRVVFPDAIFTSEFEN
jgi:hypothetical protein